MGVQELKISHGTGRYRIEILAVLTEDGISVTLVGGEKPHVGAIAMSVPRQSLQGGKISCDTWINPVPGHKDHLIASKASEMIATATGYTTAVTAGVHIKEASEAEITQLVENSEIIVKKLCEKIKIS